MKKIQTVPECTTLTLTSLYILSEVTLRMKYRSWKFPDDSPNPKMLRSSLNFIIPCLDTSTLLAGRQEETVRSEVKCEGQRDDLARQILFYEFYPERPSWPQYQDVSWLVGGNQPQWSEGWVRLAPDNAEDVLRNTRRHKKDDATKCKLKLLLMKNNFSIMKTAAWAKKE